MEEQIVYGKYIFLAGHHFFTFLINDVTLWGKTMTGKLII